MGEEKKKPGRRPGQRRRTLTERARDKREIARLRLTERLQPDEIAETLMRRHYSGEGETVNISSKQVEAEITALNKQALEDAAKDTLTLRALSIRELEDNERFCMEQFYLTQKTKTKRATKKKATSIQTGEGETKTITPAVLTEAQIERLHRDGNHSWIELYYKFRNRRYELMGIDPPTKISPTDPTGQKPYKFQGGEEMRRLMPLFTKFLKAQGEK
jgi:hypothetical protein